MELKFQWTQEMSVQHNIIDEQHKELFEKINDLLEAIINEVENDVVGDMINFFEKYMNGHLAYEEQYLKDAGYPQIEEHQKQHKVFVDKYNELRAACNSSEDGDNYNLAFDIENFMGSWLTSHILVEDQKYAKYVRQMNKK